MSRLTNSLLASLALLALVVPALGPLAPAGPAWARESPAFIAIGDSLAFGVGATDPASGGYPALVHDQLMRSERYRDRGLDLSNLGVPGATSSDLILPGGQVEEAIAEIVARQEDTSSSDDNVEIITLDIGGNDVLALAEDGSPCLGDPLSGDCQDRFFAMLDALEANVTQALERLREAAPKADIIVVDLYSPLSGRGGATEIVADLAIREMNAVTERAASRPELGAKLASVYQPFLGHAAELVAPDNLHPNDEGHAVIAEVVLAATEDRQPVFAGDLNTPTAVKDVGRPPLGEGGLQPVSGDSGEGDNLALLLAIAIPAAILGAAAVAGAYLTARGR